MIYPKNKDIYIKQSAKNIVVFIHGIFSSHTQFNTLIDKFKDLNYSIYAIALRGHGQNIKAFNHISHIDWQKQVDTILEKLTPDYENIHVIAHSMGTLLTINTEYDYKLKKVVLMSPSIKVKISLRQITLGLSVGKENPKKDYLKKYQEVTGVYFNNVFQKTLTLKPTLELLKLINITKKNLSNFSKDTMIFISKNDESVRLSSGQYTFDNISSQDKELIVLNKSRHTILDAQEENEVYKKIITFITS